MNLMNTAFTLGRALDPGYGTNRAVIAAMGVSGAAAVASAGAGTPSASLAYEALAGALAPFIPWALMRELDPDAEYAALAALPLGAFVFFFVGTPSLMAGMSVLMLTRVSNRSTGRYLHWPDACASAALVCGYAAVSGPVAAMPALLAASFGAAPGTRRMRAGMALAAVAAAVGSTAVYGLPPVAMPGLSGQAVMLAITTVVILHAARLGRVRSRDDRGGAYDAGGVRVGVSVALVAAWGMTLAGTGGPAAGTSLWAALATLGLSSAARSLRRRTYSVSESGLERTSSDSS